MWSYAIEYITEDKLFINGIWTYLKGRWYSRDVFHADGRISVFSVPHANEERTDCKLKIRLGCFSSNGAQLGDKKIAIAAAVKITKERINRSSLRTPKRCASGSNAGKPRKVSIATSDPMM